MPATNASKLYKAFKSDEECLGRTPAMKFLRESAKEISADYPEEIVDEVLALEIEQATQAFPLGAMVRPNHVGEDILGNPVDHRVRAGVVKSDPYIRGGYLLVDVKFFDGAPLGGYPVGDLEVCPSKAKQNVSA